MKSSSKIIIYDDGCPLCAAYTSAFVATGMLTPEGRKNFSDIDDATYSLIDMTKCNNEIPLLDTETKQVWYGIDALLELLDSKIPFIKFAGNIPPVKWLLQKAYKFVSYNRKVIVGSAPKAGYDCSPRFSTRYRVAFLLVFVLFNTLMLAPLHETVFTRSFIGSSSLAQLQAAHFTLMAINITIALLLGGRTSLEYLGQVNMLALTCILLILPLHLINRYLWLLNENIHNIYLGIICVVIIGEYIRRMKFAKVLTQHPLVVPINCISLVAFFTYLTN